jgi:hypothetical protein
MAQPTAKDAQMNTTSFSTAAANAIETFAATAHGAIDAYRDGGERLGRIAGERWASAFTQASPKLAPETRKNAARARKVLGGYYTRGLHLSANGARTAVDTAVRATATGMERACAFAQARAGKAT